MMTFHIINLLIVVYDFIDSLFFNHSRSKVSLVFKSSPQTETHNPDAGGSALLIRLRSF